MSLPVDKLGRMPPRHNCRGTVYRIIEHEGAIVFSVETPVWGGQSRVVWTRRSGCWYVDLSCASFCGNSVMFAHLRPMYDLIASTYGGDHEVIEVDGERTGVNGG